jgi:hypothetical protein
MNRGEGSRYR